LAAPAPALSSRRTEFDEKVAWGLKESPVHTVLVEESLIGWKEYELEVMRDAADNFVVVCSIENLDAMGVHTGDSITVAPAQTLTDKEYQRLRDQARLVMRAVGVETGGSNVQFGVDPQTGRVVVIEMNPACLALVGAGVESDRLPDCQVRRQTRGRLHAGRILQRHHTPDGGSLRTIYRLRGGQDTALGL
jgi:hypothetical protein